MGFLRRIYIPVLSRIERVIKTDVRYVMRGSTWLTYSHAVSALTTLAFAIVCARFLSKELYGTYKYVFAISSTISVFSLTGLSVAVMNSAAKGFDGTLRYVFRKNLIWSLPSLLIFFTVSGYYYFVQKDLLLAVSVCIVGLLSPLFASASLSDSVFSGKRDFKRSALTTSLASVGVTAATIVAVLLSHNLIVLVSTFMMASVVAEGVVYWYANRVYAKNADVDKEAMNYGFHLSIMSVLGGIIDRIDSLITFQLLGPAQLAVYSFAIAIPEQIKGLGKNVGTLAQPKFSHGNPDLARKTMLHKMTVFAVGMFVVSVCYIYAAPYFFHYLFPQYEEGAVFLSQVSALFLFSTANVLPVSFLQAHADKRRLYYFNVSGSVFQCIGICVGAYFGLLGIVLGVGISRVCRLIASYVLVRVSSAQTV